MSDRAREILQRHKTTVEDAMAGLLPAVPAAAAKVDEAMRYSLFAGGKRLRPALVLATAEALGGEAVNVIPSACAIEMIHTYSLIHDDLPAMDDDDLRRGRPTNHVEFGEGMAILAGDALSNTAFQVIAEHTRDETLVGPLVLELARAAGTDGMIGGQVLDILSEGAEPDMDTVRAIHRMKTAALITAAVRLGAVGSAAAPDVIERMGAFGRCIGLAFQIIDDILDEESDAATLGKTAGKDRRQQKMTYPACIGIDASRREAQALVDEAGVHLGDLDRNGDLATLAAFICSRLN